MTDADRGASSLFARCVTRREVLVASGGMMALALAACGGSPSPSSSASPATGTFIGTFGSDELIAVVVGPAGDARGLLYGPAPDDPIRTPRTFTELTSVWFDGIAVAGDKLEGSSADGYLLSATLTADAVRGAVTAPGQPARDFVAAPATGAAGLYDVTYNPADQTLTGTSAAGATVTGKAAAGTDPLAATPVMVTITPAGGTPTVVPINFYPGENPQPEQLGFIVAQDGTVRGGPRKRKSTGGESGSGGGSFTCPLID